MGLVDTVKRKLRVAASLYRNGGLKAVLVRTKNFVKKHLRKRPETKAMRAGDVLMVSIDEPLLDRYRTDHMVESLRSTGMTVDKVFYYELTPEHIKHYNVFVFYRVPWISPFEKYFAEIRRKNKVSVFAVDDLVIDTKYTDQIPVVQEMEAEDRALYDEGVLRHKKVMEACDYAVTTTEELADELRGYKNLKEVFVDRNSMSEEMAYHSNKAVDEVERDTDKIVVGYFSGTSTHNEDFQMVSPALIRLLEEDDRVHVKLAGRIDAPESLKDYADRLIFTPYVDWRKLPFELRQCDIILAPLVDTLFNRAKSEIKWSEAALAGVPVVASDIGAFHKSINDRHTGILVENTEEAWYEGIKLLIEDNDLRSRVAKESRQHVLAHCLTTGERATKLKKYIDSITPPVVAFGSVSLAAISGGNMVVKRHMDLLVESGYIVYGVEDMDYFSHDKWEELNRKDDKKYDIFRVNSRRHAEKIEMAMHFDRYVATFWASVDMVDRYTYMKKGGKKLYLVQNMEADFYPLNDKLRLRVLATYRNERLEPVTISQWCQRWLAEDFDRDAKYAPNGLDIGRFDYKERNWTDRKIRVLVEGDSASEYKRVDESFEIANKLDRTKYEVSYMSYNAKPKDWYKVDNVYLHIPYEEVGGIYAKHDILLKSSALESFSYPPLEMMATGGAAVLVKNDGNAEYVVNNENALYYEAGNIDDAIAKVELIVADKKMYKRMAKDGREMAESRAWDNVSRDVVGLYE